ncbi:MAG: hypothetical protein ACO3QA_05750 [Phycisphaerales bacterium]|jgi:hypothetical protein
MRPEKTDFEGLVERILARSPIQFERVQPIDERQIELTERWIVPALPHLEAEFLEIRAEVDEELRGHLVDHPDQALRGDPSLYPKGYCLAITRTALRRFLARGQEGTPSEALRAVLAFGEQGGHVGRIWGILRDRYFQNALQLGSHYFDVANDTVDVAKPKIEHMPMAESGFRNVTSLEDFVRTAESYWKCRLFPNLHFPRLAISSPLLQLGSQDGRLRILRLAGSIQWFNWSSDFTFAERGLRDGIARRAVLPDELFERIESFKRRRGLPRLPREGFDAARLDELCVEARMRYRNGADGERKYGRAVASSVSVVIGQDPGEST